MPRLWPLARFSRQDHLSEPSSAPETADSSGPRLLQPGPRPSRGPHREVPVKLWRKGGQPWLAAALERASPSPQRQWPHGFGERVGYRACAHAGDVGGIDEAAAALLRASERQGLARPRRDSRRRQARHIAIKGGQPGLPGAGTRAASSLTFAAVLFKRLSLLDPVALWPAAPESCVDRSRPAGGIRHAIPRDGAGSIWLGQCWLIGT